MKIKTVLSSMNFCEHFDDKVNRLMDEGWKLARRDVVVVQDKLVYYAELVKLDEADMEELEDELPAWEDAVDALRLTCGTAEECSEDGCPMWAWCQKNLDENNPPANWDDPEELDQPE